MLDVIPDLDVIVSDGLCTEDLWIVGRNGVFLLVKQFFVQLFSRTQTGVLDLDVDVLAEPTETDHLLGEVYNLDRLTHVEYEDVVSFSEEGGFQYQTAGFRNGHEITDNFRMGHGNRTSGFYLLAEQRYNGTVTTQYITETGGNEGGVSDNSIFLDGIAQTLGIHFGQSLGSTHDVTWTNGLVGGNHDELVHIVADG